MILQDIYVQQAAILYDILKLLEQQGFITLVDVVNLLHINPPAINYIKLWLLLVVLRLHHLNPQKSYKNLYDFSIKQGQQYTTAGPVFVNYIFTKLIIFIIIIYGFFPLMDIPFPVSILLFVNFYILTFFLIYIFFFHSKRTCLYKS